MATDLIKKLTTEAIDKNASYIIFEVSDSGIAYTSDGGSRKSTRNIKLNPDDITKYEKRLKGIDGNSLLFSKSVRKIEIVVRNGRRAIYEVIDSDENTISIRSKKLNETNPKVNKWILYTSECAALAFNLKEIRGGQYVVSPCDGGLYDGMFKNDSDQSLKFCVEGESKDIVELINTSGLDLIHRPEFKTSSFSVFPNSMDDQNELTISIMNVLKDICTKSPVYRNERGTKAGKGSVVLGTKEVKELFPRDICKYTFLHNKGWIRGFEEDSREELFLTDVVGITKYDKNTFLKRLFDEAYYDDLDELFAMQNDKWLRKFFVFCMDDSLDDDAKKAVKDGLRKVRCIRTARNKMVFPREATLPLEDKTTFRKRNIIKNSIVYPGGKPYECTDGLLAFLANVLCMNKYSEKSEMIQLAEEMSFKKQTIDKKYMSKLLILADYHIHSKDNINFSGYPIFPVETNRGMKRLIASEIVIGKPFFKDGDLLAKALNRPCLWSGIRKLMKSDEVDRIITFALDCGAYGKPKIVLQPAWNHPDFKKFLNVDGGRGGIDSNFDFTIPELDTILKRKSLRLNKLIWECITSIPAAYAVPYLSAEYSVNSRQIVNRCSSSLIYYLSKRTWVPDKNNKLFAPGYIDIKDISDEFVFDKNNPILKALKFGSLIVDKEAEIARIKKKARKFGLEVVSKEEYQEFMEWKG